MASIPSFTCPTITAVKQAAWLDQTREPRDYLGASLIGHPCSRAIWYEYNGIVGEPFKLSAVWAIEDGNRVEAVIADRLRKVYGINLVTENQGFSAFGGKFKGHVDGIITGLKQAPKTPHVWECKVTDDFSGFLRAIERFGEKGALQQWNERYYVQAQIYMHFMKLDRHYLTVAYSGGRDLAACRTEYREEVALQYVDKAEKIINATYTPVRLSEKPDNWQCKMCKFKGICHNENTTPLPRSGD